MIIQHSSLKKNKKNDISSSINRGKRNAHKLSPNAKSANRVKVVFIIFSLIAISASICIMSYNLLSPQIKHLQKKEKPSKTELNKGEYLMLYNHKTGKFEIAD